MANYIAKKVMNDAQNGVELYFSVFPISGTRKNLKKHGFRWNRRKSCWYAKQSTDTVSFAGICAETTVDEYREIADRTGETIEEVGKKRETVKTAAPTRDAIDLSNLGEDSPHLHGAELSKAIRADLKRRGVTGVSVRCRNSGYTTAITVTIKATAEDFASIEEMKKRYTFSQFVFDADRPNGIYDGNRWIYAEAFDQMTDEEKQETYNKYIVFQAKRFDSVNTHYLIDSRADYWEVTTPFFNKICAVFRIANQWNYDNSDSMTDYFDVGYCLDIDIKKSDGFEPRVSMTDAERTAYDEEKRLEAEKEAAELARYEEEQRQAEKRRKAAEKARKDAMRIIKENVTVEDLPESKQLYITDLVGGIGKECTVAELDECIEKNPHYNDAVITRKVMFKTAEAYDAFTKYLGEDFDFLAKMGGTASEDIRLGKVDAIWKLNEEQNSSIKWYMCNCVAIYLDGVLMLVSNPEGFGYSRYTYKMSSKSRITAAEKETEKQLKDSYAKTSFYFPESVEKQSQKLHEGQQITIYQTDGWNLVNIYGGFGTVLAVETGNYAQYKGVYITLIRGGKPHKVFIRDGKKCLVYEGIKGPLPDNLTSEKIDQNMSLILNSDELFPKVLDYYGRQGEKPIIDTIQR